MGRNNRGTHIFRSHGSIRPQHLGDRRHLVFVHRRARARSIHLDRSWRNVVCALPPLRAQTVFVIINWPVRSTWKRSEFRVYAVLPPAGGTPSQKILISWRGELPRDPNISGHKSAERPSVAPSQPPDDEQCDASRNRLCHQRGYFVEQLHQYICRTHCRLALQ